MFSASGSPPYEFRAFSKAARKGSPVREPFHLHFDPAYLCKPGAQDTFCPAIACIRKRGLSDHPTFRQGKEP